jgi:hypothetical protein
MWYSIKLYLSENKAVWVEFSFETYHQRVLKHHTSCRHLFSFSCCLWKRLKTLDWTPGVPRLSGLQQRTEEKDQSLGCQTRSPQVILHTQTCCLCFDRYSLNALSSLRVNQPPSQRLHMALHVKSKSFHVETLCFYWSQYWNVFPFQMIQADFQDSPIIPCSIIGVLTRKGLTKENGFIKEQYWQLLCL